MRIISLQLTLPLCLFILLAVVPGVLHAQVTTGSVNGTVTDSSGAAMPGARVSLLNLQTGLDRISRTNGSGTYSFEYAPIGEYRLTVQSEGFNQAVHDHLVVTAAQVLTLDIPLQLATANINIQVSSDVPVIETTSSNQTATVDEVELRTLPVQHQDWTNLLQLSAGATKPATASSVTSNGSAGSGLNLNGLPASGYNLTVDGTNASSNPEFTSFNFYQGPNIINTVNNDAIAEVSIVKGIAPATVGGTVSGTINIVTRSGGNDFHGSLYELNESNIYDARNQFLHVRPRTVFNEYGGSIGGRILKDKLFFFGSYEGGQLSAFKAVTGTVPTPYLKSLAPAVMLPILNLYPSIAQPSNASAQTATATYAGSTRQKDGNGTARFDYNLSPNDQVFIRYIRARPQLINPNIIAINARTTVGHTDSFNVGYTHAGKAWASNTRFGFSQLLLNRDDGGFGAQHPTISFGFNTGGSTLFLQHGGFTTAEEAIALTYGRHSVQIGAIFQRQNSARTRLATQGFTYSTLAGFEANTPSAIALNLYQLPSGTPGFEYNDYQYGVYVQDDWRVNTALTLNMGVRYDIFTVPQEILGRVFNRDVDPGDPALGPGYGPYRPANSMFNGDHNNVQPRLGFAYNVNGRGTTVVRGGAGVFIGPRNIYGGPVATGQVNSQTPFNLSLNPAMIASTGLTYPINGLQYQAVIQQLEASGAVSTNLPNNTVNPNFPDPYSIQWSLGLQQTMPLSTVLTVDYVGTRGLKENFYETVNLPDRVTGISPRPNYGNFFYFTPGDRSAYHGLQTTLTHPMRHGVLLSASYVWSRVMSFGDADVLQQLAPQDNHNIPAEYGRAPFDVRNRFVLHGGWRLPLPQLLHVNSRAGKLPLGGWEISGVYTGQSGLPVNLLDTASTYPADRPNYRAGGVLYLPGSRQLNACGVHQFLNGAVDASGNPVSATCNSGLPSAIQLVAISAVSKAQIAAGNLRRYSVNSPGMENFDATLMKNFDVYENMKVQLRLDAFNALNHTNLSGLVTSAQTTNYGQLTQATARTVQIGGRLTF